MGELHAIEDPGGTQLHAVGERRIRDHALSRLAERQHGVVARRQLLDLGFTARQVARMLAAGRLVALYRGVYALGHCALRHEGRFLAASLCGGQRAVISHRSAAQLWDIRSSSRAVIDVTTPSMVRCTTRAIDFHVSRRLAASEIALHHGVPVTSVERTIADLAPLLARRDLERTIERAEMLWSLDVRRTLAAARHRGGSGLLQSIVADWAPAPTRSVLEDRLLELVRRSGLPEPRISAQVHGFEVDLSWSDHRLVVEADGHAFHSSRGAIERDRRRDATLTRHGYRVLRFTWVQVTQRPQEVVDALRAALAQTSAASELQRRPGARPAHRRPQ